MDCLLCFSPDLGKDIDSKNKSLSEFDYDIDFGKKYARSLCQLLQLDSVTYQEYFLLPNIRFCVSCLHFVGNVMHLFEQLDELQKQISESSVIVQQRLLNCQCPAEEQDSSEVSANVLRREIIKSIQIHRNKTLENDLCPTSKSGEDDEAGTRNENEYILTNVVKDEEIEVDTKYFELEDECQSSDNSWSPPPPSIHTDEINDDQSLVEMSISTSKKTRSKRAAKRNWKLVEKEETETQEEIPIQGLKENKVLKIILTRLEDLDLDCILKKEHVEVDPNKKLKKATDSDSVPELNIDVESEVKETTSHSSQDRPYACTFPDCSKRFKNAAGRSFHISKVHGVPATLRNRFPCPHCRKIFKSAEQVDAHVGIHSGEADEDAVQNIVLEYNPKPKEHGNASGNEVGTSRQDRSVSCTVSSCPMKLKSVASLCFHLRNVHKMFPKPARTQCPHCPKTYPAGQKLEDHIRIHTGECPFICEICGKRFRTSEFLKSHSTLHTGQRKAACPHCPLKFPHKTSLQIHIDRVHKRKYSFMCEICSASFLAKNELRYHQMKLHTEELNLNPLQCRTCDKILANPQNLKSHILIHEKVLRAEGLDFKCSVQGCSASFERASRLKIHMQSHSEERNHSCHHPQCGKRFKSKGALVEHLRTHNKEKRFKCPDCSLSFNFHHDLRRHIDGVHSKIRNFMCPFCGKGFPRSRYLDVHIERHTTGKLPIPGYNEQETL